MRVHDIDERRGEFQSDNWRDRWFKLRGRAVLRLAMILCPEADMAITLHAAMGKHITIVNGTNCGPRCIPMLAAFAADLSREYGMVEMARQCGVEDELVAELDEIMNGGKERHPDNASPWGRRS